MIGYCEKTNFVLDLYVIVVGLFVTFMMCGAMIPPLTSNKFQMSEFSKSHPLLASLYNTAASVKQVDATHRALLNQSEVHHPGKGQRDPSSQLSVVSSQMKDSFDIKELIDFQGKPGEIGDQLIGPNFVSTQANIMCSLCRESGDIDCMKQWCLNIENSNASTNEANSKIKPIVPGIQKNVADIFGKGSFNAIKPQVSDAVGKPIVHGIPVDVANPTVDLITAGSSDSTKSQTLDAAVNVQGTILDVTHDGVGMFNNLDVMKPHISDAVPNALDIIIPVAPVHGGITPGIVKPGIVGDVNQANARQSFKVETLLTNDTLEPTIKADTSMGATKSFTNDTAKSIVSTGRIVQEPVPELDINAMETLMSLLMTDIGANDSISNATPDHSAIDRNPMTNTSGVPPASKDSHAADFQVNPVGNVHTIRQQLNTSVSNFLEKMRANATIERIPQRHIEISSARFPFGEGPTRPPIVVQTRTPAPTIQTMDPIRKQELRQLSNVLMEQLNP